MKGRNLAKLPAGIVALGFVSLLMDVSSEMIHGLLPVFIVGTLGASAAMLGLIEGMAEATASVTKLFSGLLSDRMGKRKPLAVLGYGLSALTKPLFALAGGAGMVATARFADRVGKGIRGAPRDALVADLVPEAQRGAAYGLRQSMDTIGAFLGPLLAMALMLAFAGNVRLVFWLAIIPAAMAVAVLVIYVREPEAAAKPAVRPKLDRASLAALGRGFWAVVALASVMTLARFSEAFLILRAEGAGLGLTFAPMVLVVMNVIYAASAWPVGVLSDRIGKAGLLAFGFAVLVAADLVLAFAPGLTAVLLGVALWGLHMGLTQGLLATQVAAAAPAALRGTAFGVYNLVTGLVLLAANALAGGLWTALGPQTTFLAGAGFAAIGVIGLQFAAQRR
ncbi:major facilitator superfamily MFS_1 [Rhodobacter ferrooxidans]|uniref:Major facilitator superfamily MFS_1 n=1 Tax=Rhodobacter ferrooxidans TaxID=371731 RepID=C8RY52_9RHOB|nr:major facilitator superfamily MFS_1 [Rhodobacter sp. SW2]